MDFVVSSVPRFIDNVPENAVLGPMYAHDAACTGCTPDLEPIGPNWLQHAAI